MTSTTTTVAIITDITPTRATIVALNVTIDDLDDMDARDRVANVPADCAVGQRVRLGACEVIADPHAVLA